jgi:DNA-binding protein H-NS
MAQRLETIRAQIRELEKQAQSLQRGANKGIRAAARIIAKHGLSLSDLKAAIGMTPGPRGRRSPLAAKTVPAKFRDQKGNTWTGRGRPPLWLVAAEKAGQKRESFLIAAKPSKTRAKAKASPSAPPARRPLRPKQRAGLNKGQSLRRWLERVRLL